MALELIGNMGNFKESRPVQIKTVSPAPAPVQMDVKQVSTDTQGVKYGNDDQNAAGKQATEQQMKLAVLQASNKMKFGHTNAQFSYHEGTKRISIKIIDNETNEVIKEIPPEETLEMISKMWELAGLMVDEKR